MARFKATAFVDGKETEVELDDTKVITVEQHNVRVKDTVRQRLSRQAVNLKGELLKDEEFVNEVLKAKGVDPKTLKPAATDGKTVSESEIASLQEKWRNTELKPVQEQLAKATTTIEKTRNDSLVTELENALTASGFKPSVAKRFAKAEAARFGFDEKSGKPAVRKADGFEFSTNASDEAPYKGPAEWAKEFAADPENVDFLEKRGQEGPRVGNEKQSGTGSITSRKQLTSDAARSEFISKHGLEKYTQLPAE